VCSPRSAWIEIHTTHAAHCCPFGQRYAMSRPSGADQPSRACKQADSQYPFPVGAARYHHHLMLRNAICGIPLTGDCKLLWKENAMTHNHWRSCSDACIRCAEACEHCAASCLQEADVGSMADCIRLDRDCAEACWLAAGFMCRGSPFAADLCRVCGAICDACANECETHDAEHCRSCAEACRRCEEECRRMAVVPA